MPSSLIIHALENTPDLLALHASNPERYPHLLTSNASTEEKSDLARYDILFAFPQQTIESCSGDFLQQLDLAWQTEKLEMEAADLPFTGGWFLYLGYELAQQIETGLILPEAEDALPVAFATRFPAAIIIDSHNQKAFIVCESKFNDYVNQIQTDLINQLNNVEDKSSSSSKVSVGSSVAFNQAFHINDIQEDNEENYLQQLELLHKYIIDGDVFQVNLSRCWKTQLDDDVTHASIYHQLSQSNPGPFNALVTLGDKAIISSSPERLIQSKSGYLQTRPIAGTRPRAEDSSTDSQLSDELLANAKEQAEHIMLIDLERNDMGRVCEPGSIEVNELMVLESYQHVHHIVSNVQGRLRQGITPGQLIAAVFPGGTITGCPKVRCMEILAELEGVGRGAYTGSLGYLNHDGSMDLNILIRTITRNGNKLQFRAGGGIVVDSDPNNELNETRAKAKGLIHALQTGNQ
ncbi:MAG: aminodeoxychorismate synthase component I [endosymbiont of Galathealinum brachiosum]|uniref:Aminodeoxychorismate synthase component I n=1 Tax=endosymbiont of Galathealinum brachiosum TaxID=2200906 RepID=A0A370DNG7_9GAMM|nr:MAG: aminodeoxychorismate synthase component I [endosymbiont of Galathealinum brachiosum]